MMQQYNVGMRWETTNWNGASYELARIAKSTLVITGTDDNADMPHENSLITAGKIPRGRRFVQQPPRACLIQYSSSLVERNGSLSFRLVDV